MAKKKKERVKQPMLYITQPDFEKASPNMQSVYRTERKPLTKKSEDSQESGKQLEAKAEAAETENAANSNETPTQERTKRGPQRRKRYSLGLEESDRSRPAGYDPFLGRPDPFKVANEDHVEREQENEIDLQEPQNDQESEGESPEKVEEKLAKQLDDFSEPESHNEETQPMETNEREEKRRVSFTNRNRRSRFKDMSLEDKVDYFVNLPSQVPRMKCEVITEEERYKGWIEDYEEGTVYMKILQRPFRVEVPFDDIHDIVLRGF
ncbi:CotO family spore coat protein [Pontibacillus salipaludis]|uniref:CotO family spore coat protein n=1 Tax=Pontibacillus salipaludis TaxID=1697394 RepID=UPI0031EF0DE9